MGIGKRKDGKIVGISGNVCGGRCIIFKLFRISKGILWSVIGIRNG
nr:hypothetical protein [Staphylococcus epidermidis]